MLLGKFLLPSLRVTKPLSTGLFKFPRESPTFFVTSLPIIGYFVLCLTVGSTFSLSVFPDPKTYDWLVVDP